MSVLKGLPFCSAVNQGELKFSFSHEVPKPTAIHDLREPVGELDLCWDPPQRSNEGLAETTVWSDFSKHLPQLQTARMQQ